MTALGVEAAVGLQIKTNTRLYLPVTSLDELYYGASR